jgi:phosphoribosyl-ATP pyrophosphohydrolase
MGIRKLMSKVQRPPLDRLERTIASRAANPKEKSYTCQLLAGGVPKIGAKVTEEAAEVVEAAGESGEAGRKHFLHEVGDLLYHLLVLMRFRDCTLIDVETELARRFGVSGLDEKASRKPKVSTAQAANESKKTAIKKQSSRAKLTAKVTAKAKRKSKR